MKKINCKSRKGFTLIELLVVIGILAVLAAIAIPSVAGLIDRANMSADDTNANEMTNAIERFVSEYELYCQDIASNRIDFDDLDSAQSRVYNVTGIEDKNDITEIENRDLDGKQLNKDTKYPANLSTAKAIVENYTKTSSATFFPKQSDMHFYYSPECGIVIWDTASDNYLVTDTTLIGSLNKQIVSGKDAKGKELSSSTVWYDLAFDNDTVVYEEVSTNYTDEEIDNNEHLIPIGKTDPYYVVAEYNTDYTKLTISKNGENSDGLMKDWTATNSDFAYNTTIKEVIIKEGVKNIGANIFWYAKGIEIVNIANSVINIGDSAFNHCENLTDLTLSKNVISLGIYSFYYCNFEDIILPSTVTTINDYAFAHCENLKSIVLNNGLKTLGTSVFYECYALEKLIIPDTVTSIGTHIAYGCTNLKEVKISNQIPEITSSMFSHCSSLTNIVIPDSVTKINTFAFYYCTNLSSITLSKNLECINGYAFNYTKVKEFYLPASVKEFQNFNFTYIPSGSVIYCETQEIADLFIDGKHYYSADTTIITDPSKF